MNPSAIGGDLSKLLGYGQYQNSAPVPYAPPSTPSSPNGYFRAVAAAPSGGGSVGGGGVLGASTQAPVDPFAAYGGRAAYDSKVGSINAQRQGLFGSVNDAIGGAANSYKSSILDYLDSLRAGQRTIDAQGVQNELAKKQGTQNILGMVGRGIRSGGVILNNKNASSSSATKAIADAYGQLGREQLSNVGNQYEQGQNAINEQQMSFQDQQAQGLRHLDENKQNVINNIVTQARTQLANLDSSIAGASLPDRINVEAEKEKIRQQALTALQQYDAQLSQGVSGVTPTSQQARMGQAATLANAGTAPENAFDFTTQLPAQFQNGPFSSTLPLFSSRGRKAA